MIHNPYNYGDSIEDWDRFKYCPECGCKSVDHCRCHIKYQICPNDHHWHQDNNTVQPGHGHEEIDCDKLLIDKMAKQISDEIEQKVIEEIRQEKFDMSNKGDTNG